MHEDHASKLLDMLQGNAEDAPAVIIQDNHGTVIINHHPPAAQPEAITEPQSRFLKSLVYQIGEEERKANPAYCDAKTWVKINGLLGVDHHRDIRRRDFDRAKSYLEGWLRRLKR